MQAERAAKPTGAGRVRRGSRITADCSDMLDRARSADRTGRTLCHRRAGEDSKTGPAKHSERSSSNPAKLQKAPPRWQRFTLAARSPSGFSAMLVGIGSGVVLGMHLL